MVFRKKASFTMKIVVSILIFSLLFISFFSFANAHEKAPLDEIQNYEIKIDMRPDGTMDIRYHIEWKVLDDTLEGPLSWVKIGTPNSHVDEITAISSNIKNIGYYSDNGSYIRIDFDREYHKDEIISFDYSIHQSYMYVIDKDMNLCKYSFTAGWFDDIEVKNITIYWNENNVLESTAKTAIEGYLVWSASLEFGERLNASVKYNLDVFTTNEDEQYVEGDSEDDGIGTFIIIFLVIIGVVLLITFIAALTDDYGSHGGFGGGGGYRSTYVSTCVRSSCACVRSCACACACAGGGRAGCSKKDFYNTKLNIEDIKKALK